MQGRPLLGTGRIRFASATMSCRKSRGSCWCKASAWDWYWRIWLRRLAQSISSKCNPPSISWRGRSTRLPLLVGVCVVSRGMPPRMSIRSSSTAPTGGTRSFHLCKSYAACTVQSQEQLFSWSKLALGWHSKGLPIGVSTYQKHTQSGNKAVGEKVVSIFAATRDRSIWCCHKHWVEVSIVSKQTQPWCKEATFQLGEERHPFECQTVRGWSRIQNWHL